MPEVMILMTVLLLSAPTSPNQLEQRAFILKDSVFVIGDYALSAINARELEAKAARLLRGRGNLSSRDCSKVILFYVFYVVLRR